MFEVSITSEALASMPYGVCLQRAVEEAKKGHTAEKEARQAKKKSRAAKIRAMYCFAGSGFSLREAYAKGEAESKTRKQTLEEFCAAIGKSERTAADYVQLAEHWHRIPKPDLQHCENAASRNNPNDPPMLPTFPLSLREFKRLLAEVDGKDEREPPAPAGTKTQTPQKGDWSPFELVMLHWDQILKNLPSASQEERNTFAGGAQQVLKSYTTNSTLEAATRLETLLQKMRMEIVAPN